MTAEFPNTETVSHRIDEPWPIDRSWSITSDGSKREHLRTSDLGAHRVNVLQGAAGLGKTFEMRRLAEMERQRSSDVHFVRLVEFAQTADGLESRLTRLSRRLTNDSVLFLDAMDEITVPVKFASLVIATWVRDKLARHLPRLRISFRPVTWSDELWSALQATYGADSCVAAALLPMSDEDVRRVAEICSIDGDALVMAVARSGACSLASHPLTLKLLLREFALHGDLPTSRQDLFERATNELALERDDRVRTGTNLNTELARLLDAAECLACLLLLSGRDSVDLSDNPSSTTFGRAELALLRCGRTVFTDDILHALCHSGLCESDARRQFRFIHRQFAEYLAGRRIARLLPHQAKALLSDFTDCRPRIAGPLRETAAFTALQSPGFADWLAINDPEVVGLSDVADGNLRRRAMLAVLDRFRNLELTDSQLLHGRIEFAGFRYPNPEDDLRRVLRERSPGCEDLVQCAVGIVASWRLDSMADDLADVVLDVTAPLEARRAAGYALLEMDVPAAKARLMPLIFDDSTDPLHDLKGLALRCNWPERISVPNLLAAIATPTSPGYGGAYSSFLYSLDGSRFDAASNRLDGLHWARHFLDHDGDILPQGRIARRITIGAVGDLPSVDIAAALADIVVEAARDYVRSPLILPERHSLEGEKPERAAEFSQRPEARRALVDAMAAIEVSDSTIWWALHETPDIVLSEDFPWLIERAIDLNRPMRHRENYAHIARMTRFDDCAANVEAWLEVSDIEPIASVFRIPRAMELSSPEAIKARDTYIEAESLAHRRSLPRRKLEPAPSERVERLLELCEMTDYRHFFGLCREMTLEEDSTQYRPCRILTKSPGWRDASEDTRGRIVAAAKRFLVSETETPESCTLESLNSSVPGAFSAIWIVFEIDKPWLESLPTDWWRRWGRFILRELHFGTSDNVDVNKTCLLQMLHARAGSLVRESLAELVDSSVQGASHLLSYLLDISQNLEDSQLEDTLCRRLTSSQVAIERVGDVARFVLSRAGEHVLVQFGSLLSPNAMAAEEDRAVAMAVALLVNRPRESWQAVHGFLERRPDLASRVLGEFARRSYLQVALNRENVTDAFDCKQAGELIAQLLVHFPPEADAAYGELIPQSVDTSARDLRDRLIEGLVDIADEQAVQALKSLERRFGERYRWLRRPRSRAEQQLQRSRWRPIPARSVAEVLSAQNSRLIRSATDAANGIMAAIEQFETTLRRGGLNDLDDLWDRPRGRSPTPKAEERVSEKICGAIRGYFEEYAVTADREVQIFRRLLSRRDGGASGSRPDIFCHVPARGTLNLSDPIVIPIEVKLSHNPEAKTALTDQLTHRYVVQSNAEAGIMIVAWMGRPKGRQFRPRWPSLAAAKRDLQAQADTVMAEFPGITIFTAVIDASLPTAKKAIAKKPSKNKTPSAAAGKNAAKTKRKKTRKSKKTSRASKTSVVRTKKTVKHTGTKKTAKTNSVKRKGKGRTSR